MPSEDSPCQ